MNFKKTLGLVLTAALVSSSIVAVKPAKAATTSATPVVATAPISSTVQSFSYFFAQKSLAFDGDRDSCVVSTAYNGQVQYEMWVKQVSDPNAKWQVVSKGADGKPGYAEATDGNNSLYTIPLVDGFSFKQGNYIIAVYAKVANTDGAKSNGLKIDGSGVAGSTGTEQKFDVATSAKLQVKSSSDKQKYDDVMSGDFMFTPGTLVAGQKTTFKGFASQKDGAKYKFIVRKSGTDGSDIKNYTFLNDSFQSSVDWTPAEAGTYEVIAWSEAKVNKGGARDGWAISTVTVAAAPVQSKLTVTKVADFNPFMGVQQITVNDSSLVSKVLVDGKETKFSAPDATTVRMVLDNEPTTIVLVDKDGNQVTAKGGSTPTTKTLTVTKVADFNPFMGVQQVTVNDSSLVSKVLINGKEAKFSAPDATTVRLVLDDEPTSIVLVDAQGNQVTAK
ncbi:hypothetical protein ACJDT4_01810 [Clostridium neuense]|uniref:Uncharacterized protein n=1 Tax=Clostridium neuense TaxID=1728934 RepID=A0ABW8TBQ8_9CLOT